LPIYARWPCGFDQAEAVEGDAKDGGQIGVVGLVVGIGGLTILLGGEGMNQTRVPVAVAAGTLHGPMIFASAFDSHGEVFDVVLQDDLVNAVEGSL
jgi:hypothetical protein